MESWRKLEIKRAEERYLRLTSLSRRLAEAGVYVVGRITSEPHEDVPFSGEQLAQGGHDEAVSTPSPQLETISPHSADGPPEATESW